MIEVSIYAAALEALVMGGSLDEECPEIRAVAIYLAATKLGVFTEA